MPDDITDLLDSQKGKKIMIKLRNGKVVYGILRDFDIHMTMKLDSAEETMAQQDNADGSGGGAAATAGSEPETAPNSESSPLTHIGSVLLRGDNILLISILDDADGNDASSGNDNGAGSGYTAADATMSGN